MAVKSIKLLSGLSAPWIAFGSGTAFFKQNCTSECKVALSSGFTHIDTAQMYENEEFVGQAIKECGIPRDRLFITTKLWELKEGQTVQGTLEESLRKLGIPSVDLFLVHAPTHHKEREGGVEQLWREMVDMQKKGLTKSVGVSNFNKAELEKIIALDIGMPEVNQVSSFF